MASTIGAVFEDGRTVDSFATEMFIRSGRIEPGADGVLMPTSTWRWSIIAANLAEGRLKRGANPILMTLEVVIEAAVSA